MRLKILIFILVAVTVETLVYRASRDSITRARPPRPQSSKFLALRDEAERTDSEYRHLRDKLEDQYMAAIQAYDDNPSKMKEADEQLEPLRAEVKKLGRESHTAWLMADAEASK
jgi:uncharacterized protein HemX